MPRPLLEVQSRQVFSEHQVRRASQRALSEAQTCSRAMEEEEQHGRMQAQLFSISLKQNPLGSLGKHLVNRPTHG